MPNAIDDERDKVSDTEEVIGDQDMTLEVIVRVDFLANCGSKQSKTDLCHMNEETFGNFQCFFENFMSRDLFPEKKTVNQDIDNLRWIISTFGIDRLPYDD
jgi:hypothetical protein